MTFFFYRLGECVMPVSWLDRCGLRGRAAMFLALRLYGFEWRKAA